MKEIAKLEEKEKKRKEALGGSAGKAKTLAANKPKRAQSAAKARTMDAGGLKKEDPATEAARLLRLAEEQDSPTRRGFKSSDGSA